MKLDSEVAQRYAHAFDHLASDREDDPGMLVAITQSLTAFGAAFSLAIMLEDPILTHQGVELTRTLVAVNSYLTMMSLGWLNTPKAISGGVLYLALLVIFNPIAPIHFTQPIWKVINVLAFIMCVTSIFFVFSAMDTMRERRRKRALNRMNLD